MEIKVVHVIRSSEEEKRGEWGEEKSSKEEIGMMEETMVTRQGWRHSEDLREVRTEHGYGRKNSKETELPAVDEPLLCCGLVCRCHTTGICA